MIRVTRSFSIMLVIFALALTACAGVKISFGKQRTPPPVTTVTNDHPAFRARPSNNWSGYTATASNVTSVSATWQVPQVTGDSDSDSSVWVGIGGIQSDSLIQAGTDQVVQDGKAHYFAWVEMLPDLPKPLVDFEVLPGDSVQFSITYTGASQWQVKAVNLTTSQAITKSYSYASCQCSAEWIVEAPTANDRQTALANFASVTFVDCMAVMRGQKFALSDLEMRPRPIRMVNSVGDVLAEPQVLDGDGFSVVWLQE